ncbi:D-ribose transporter ATP-binding protein [Verrucomicrobiaceae bacterium SCGC AG-212-N21]|nr:D-ribose transporter ATP-binding protein [Verrucomicrobiaceae bacterium SCGC AG-212-N21]
MDASPQLLCATGLSKRFPGVVALDDVSLSADKGEVVAVIGENGAGKSTLMKILAGIYAPDAGDIEFDGSKRAFSGVLEAQKAGIALIHQELNLADNLDVAGNVFLGREPSRRGFIAKREMHEKTQVLLKRLGATFSASAPVASLSLGQQQMVEIAKALSLDAKLLIMDEPTSSLSTRETQTLFEVMRSLKEAGMSILYISHRLGEVKMLADRVVALRDGKNAGELSKQQISHDTMVRLMVGRDLSQVFAHQPQEKSWVVLDVHGLRTQAHPKEVIGFDLHRGEIVGLAGLVGSGRTELLRALFGVEPPLSGNVIVNGKPLEAQHPRDAIAAGLALVPEDRKALGVFLPESVSWNVALPAVERDAHGIFRNRAAERHHAERSRETLRIKTATLDTAVGTLSGGNQQKVALGKWLAMRPKVLLLDEPTRGIDVGAKREIYQLMEQLAGEGMAILFVSSEMEEVLAMSDRVLVMHEGGIAGELKRDELSEEAVMRLATGSGKPRTPMNTSSDS